MRPSDSRPGPYGHVENIVPVSDDKPYSSSPFVAVFPQNITALWAASPQWCKTFGNGGVSATLTDNMEPLRLIFAHGETPKHNFICGDRLEPADLVLKMIAVQSPDPEQDWGQ